MFWLFKKVYGELFKFFLIVVAATAVTTYNVSHLRMPGWFLDGLLGFAILAYYGLRIYRWLYRRV